jgi:hypothetical protein
MRRSALLSKAFGATGAAAACFLSLGGMSLAMYLKALYWIRRQQAAMPGGTGSRDLQVMKKSWTGRMTCRVRGPAIGLCALLILIGPWGAAPVRADKMSSEEAPIYNAADIPSQLERGFNPPVPPKRAGILPRRPFEKFRKAHPFLRDAKLTLHLRNYYFNRDDLADRDIRSWAQGGWLRLVSGRVWDAFFVGATLYGSYKLDGSEDGGAAVLLTPGQENITVLGELYAKFNYAGYWLKLGRQEYDMPFLNRQDSRMIPNTFEGYSLSFLGEGNSRFQYGVGYVQRMKRRNSDTFVYMSEAAGVPGVKRGALAFGGRYKVAGGLALDAFDVYTPDILNIFYAEVVSRRETQRGVGLRFAAQFIHQESVGDGLLERAAGSTYALGGKTDLSYRKAVLTLALTGNSSSGDLISPYGSYGGYNAVIINDYRRAGEYGLRAGLSYDFSQIGLEGLSAFGNFVWGFGAIDAETGEDAPDRNELDLTLDHRFRKSWLKGLVIRLRAAMLEEEGGRSAEDYRVIVNYAF